MSLDTATIGVIVEEELGRVQDPVIRKEGFGVYAQYLLHGQDTRQSFCRERIAPRIRRVENRQQRKKMWQVYHRVNEGIAGIAARDALALEHQRQSARQMYREILEAYDLVQRQGRGIVYFGSARSNPGDPDYEGGRILGREVAELLRCTSWSGAGPGAMEGPLRGAKEVGGKIGGIKIMIDGGESSFEQDVSDVFGPDEVVVCKFFAPRKVGLVDAGMIQSDGDRGGFVYLPGGSGTMDEFFEVFTLKQLKKLGSVRDVPVLIMNYGGYNQELLAMLQKMYLAGKIGKKDFDLFKVCNTNREALDYLADFFNIPEERRAYRQRTVDVDYELLRIINA